jgi:hypothetical protein
VIYVFKENFFISERNIGATRNNFKSVAIKLSIWDCVTNLNSARREYLSANRPYSLIDFFKRNHVLNQFVSVFARNKLLFLQMSPFSLIKPSRSWYQLPVHPFRLSKSSRSYITKPCDCLFPFYITAINSVIITNCFNAITKSYQLLYQENFGFSITLLHLDAIVQFYLFYQPL